MTPDSQQQVALQLVGPASIDRYVDEAVELPGGGALNMAYHWRSVGHPVTLLSRVAVDHATPFDRFVAKHNIAVTEGWHIAGVPSSIDIRIDNDRQPLMDGFVDGVLSEFRLNPVEVDLIAGGTPTHFVLVDVVDAALHAVTARQPTDTSRARWTGDFLSFRHMNGERFSATMAHLELGIVGWPGDPDDAEVTELATRAADLGRTLIVTFGSKGVLLVDGRGNDRIDQWFQVDARPVAGTTVGCGDAFAAAALSTWFRTGDLIAAVDAGRRLGAAATDWVRPLPDAAYSEGA
ncbi:MAG: carbohydrate kinase family protein [Actinobacteria bacterium]|nr:carbohydrate kinase family protein [Actinomycetota bacterium]